MGGGHSVMGGVDLNRSMTAYTFWAGALVPLPLFLETDDIWEGSLWIFHFFLRGKAEWVFITRWDLLIVPSEL